MLSLALFEPAAHGIVASHRESRVAANERRHRGGKGGKTKLFLFCRSHPLSPALFPPSPLNLLLSTSNEPNSAATDVEIKDAPPPVEYFETFGDLDKKVARCVFFSPSPSRGAENRQRGDRLLAPVALLSRSRPSWLTSPLTRPEKKNGKRKLATASPREPRRASNTPSWPLRLCREPSSPPRSPTRPARPRSPPPPPRPSSTSSPSSTPCWKRP